MTIGDALRRLHAAGRIRSPWLPGVLVNVPESRGVTVYGTTPARRVGDFWVWPSGFPAASAKDIERYCEPDLTDPATVGCLMALLREASPYPRGHTQSTASGRWDVFGCSVIIGLQPTEGEAIAAALVALAEALP